MSDLNVTKVCKECGTTWTGFETPDHCPKCNGAVQRQPPADVIEIVFDGPPGPEAGRFVEVEDGHGHSISIGEWVHRTDGYWVLRIARISPPADEKAWLIESGETLPRWWTGEAWSHDANEAIRFSRQIDADRCMVMQRLTAHCYFSARATEHEWVKP